MKKSFIGISIVVILLTACNSDTAETKESSSKTSDSAQATVNSTGSESLDTASIRDIVYGYLQLKNALVVDNAKDASNAGKILSESLKNFNKETLTPDQKKNYEEVEADIKEHAKHIEDNADKIIHQREHFEMLSKDMYDLVKAFGAGQTLYKDHCPMYNDGKGANWLSETKEIKNPYLGKKMPDCGTVKEELK